MTFSKNKAGFDWFYQYGPTGQVVGVYIERDCKFCSESEVLFITKNEIEKMAEGQCVADLKSCVRGYLYPRLCPFCIRENINNPDIQRLARSMTLIKKSIVAQWINVIQEWNREEIDD